MADSRNTPAKEKLFHKRTRPQRITLLILILVIIIGIALLYIRYQRDINSATSDECSAKAIANQQEPPAECLPGFNTPHVELNLPNTVSINSDSTTKIAGKIKNNQTFTRIYEITLDAADNVTVKGLPIKITLNGGETKNFTILVTPLESHSGAHGDMQLGASPSGGDPSDSMSANTDFNVR